MDTSFPYLQWTGSENGEFLVLYVKPLKFLPYGY